MLTVSNYHYVRENFTANYPSIFGLIPSEFKKQLLLLKEKGDFVSSKELLLNLNEILKSNEDYFFITFDDGLKEQYNYAVPILDELKIPAVLFANSRNYQDNKVSTVHKIHLLRSLFSSSDLLKKITTYIPIKFSKEDNVKAKSIYIYDDNESALLKYFLNFKINFTFQEEIIKEIFDVFYEEQKVLEELYMSKNEIINLGKNGFLGSHTHNHYPIGLLQEEEITFELENSKLYFEELTKTKVEMVSYPYGTPEACTNKVAQIAQNLGYKLGFTTTRGVNKAVDNNLLLNRYDCNDLIGGKNYK